jgi:osmotically inducible protein OsmC
MKRSAQAVWKNGGKSGKGTLTTDSVALDHAPYSFLTRFENEKGTNPEELIAAAHAGCFSMALAFMLEGAGFKADQIETSATVNLQNPNQQGWVVTDIHLSVNARVPNLDAQRFNEIAENAKANCPISKLLNAKITLSTQFAEQKAA